MTSAKEIHQLLTGKLAALPKGSKDAQGLRAMLRCITFWNLDKHCAGYQATSNPIFAFLTLLTSHEGGVPAPHWVVDYLSDSAEVLLNDYKPGLKFNHHLASSLGFKNSNGRGNIYTQAVTWQRKHQAAVWAYRFCERGLARSKSEEFLSFQTRRSESWVRQALSESADQLLNPESLLHTVQYFDHFVNLRSPHSIGRYKMHGWILPTLTPVSPETVEREISRWRNLIRKHRLESAHQLIGFLGAQSLIEDENMASQELLVIDSSLGPSSFRTLPAE